MPSADDPDDALSEVLAALAVSARQANLRRCEVVAEGLAAWAGGTLDEERRAAAEQAAHQVVGSAGTFGNRHASELAAALEDRFAALGAATGEPGRASAEEVEQAREQLEELQREVQGGHQVEE